MHQRRSMETSQKPIVTFDALSQFSSEMRDQTPTGPPPGKRKARSQIKIRINTPNETPPPAPPEPGQAASSSALISTPALSFRLSKLLTDSLPSERDAGAGITVHDLCKRYEPAKRREPAGKKLPASGVVSDYKGEVDLSGFAVVFTTVPTPLWRKALWGWGWDRWPVDVYIEFTGRAVDDPTGAPLYLCFGLDAERALPRITAYRNRDVIPNQAGPHAAKTCLPMSSNPHTCDLYRYCQELADRHNTDFAYMDRAEDFCARHVPCCGEALGALFLSWSSRRVPSLPCIDPGCLPIVNAETRRAYADTGGEIWTAARLVYSALWVVVFERYADYCAKHGFTSQAPASVQAFFRQLMALMTASGSR